MCVHPEAVFNNGFKLKLDIAQFALSSETDFSSLVRSSDHLVCPGLVKGKHSSSGHSIQRGYMHRVGFKAGCRLSRELQCAAGERTAGPGWAGAGCMSHSQSEAGALPQR